MVNGNLGSGGWKGFCLALFLSVFSYVLMEWLFDVTKPSFMSAFSFGEQISILLVTAALGTLLCLLANTPFFLLSLLPTFKKRPAVPLFLASLLPAAVLAALLLMMIDNFSYTLFYYGIVTSQGLVRGAYGLLFLALWAFGVRTVAQTSAQLARWTTKGPAARFALPGLAAVLLLTLIPLLISSLSGNHTAQMNSTASAASQPNILFITSDGVDAAHLSTYGYERDTTPRIKELAQTSLFAENAFPNAGNTSGSLVSFLTSKYPTETRLLYPPDILTGANAYQHLAGILNAQGYQTVQFGSQYYADAYTLNVLDGFDISNGRSATQSGLLATMQKNFPSQYAYFIYDLLNRIVDRLRHIFFLKTMTNPYDLVTKPPEAQYDRTKMKDLLDLIHKSRQPLFVQIHLMGTHGPKFRTDQQTFSAGQAFEDQKDWSIDFYDDSILEFDQNVGAIIDELKRDYIYDDTILVIGTDHAQKYVTNRRIPLIIHFPDGQFAGRIQANAQVIDVAPTVLGYLGLPRPEWMQGQSLLEGTLPERPVFGVSVNLDNMAVNQEGFFGSSPQKVNPPFYQFGKISLVYCQRWYQLNLTSSQLESGQVGGSTANCPNIPDLTDEQAVTMLADQLKAGRIDTSSLTNAFPFLAGAR